MKSVKSCQREKLMGSQEPSVRIVPDYEYSDGDDAVKILKIGKLRPDPWQENAMLDWMGRNEEELWASSTCGLSVPRQNGKTLNVSGRSAAGMVLFGEWVVYTAHLQKTATETFLELRGLFESPKLSKYVREIRNALGREQIILKNGGRIVFVARTRNGGRGLHGDLLIFDEAQELTTEQQASFLPALAASRNPQTIYIGTPPDEHCEGTVFRKIRDKAISGKSDNTSWSEFSEKEIGDVNDRSRWYRTNPALGRRILESTIASECEQMDPDTFARERLGWWSPILENKEEYAIDKDAWNKCISEESKPEGKTAYGIKFSIDGTEVCLCGAVIPENGPARISQIERKSTSQSTRWLSDWLNERYHDASCVVVDGRNGVDLLVDRISETWRLKSSMIRPNAKDMISAATLLIDSVNENSLTWYRYQEDLNDSAINSTKRSIGGGYGFGGSNSIPIEACALALWGAKTSKRDPKRKMRIG